MNKSVTAVSPLRSWYNAPISEFVSVQSGVVCADLVHNSAFSVSLNQRDAWLVEIDVLQKYVAESQGHIFLEFVIPRMGSRVDAVLIIGAVIFLVELKVGAREVLSADTNQVWDYALDFKNFHRESHQHLIVPVLLATEIKLGIVPEMVFSADGVSRPVAVRPDQLQEVICRGLSEAEGRPAINPVVWAMSPYHPTPTIIEAARALYARHSVVEIARHDAGAKNLRATACRVEAIIEDARLQRQKVICFVTGVPGAGKTLVGLDVATRRSEVGSSTHAVFLSGNGPLVAVLREALTRDEFERRRLSDPRARKGEIGNSVKAFIQNVHHFRDEALIDPNPPEDRVAIFDEAQRAWDRRQTSNFMRRRKNRPDFNQSEPEFLISYLDRHVDWAVIVCLVGGGQEINTGEAGIREWIEAIENHFPKWRVHLSPNLTDSEYGASERIATFGGEYPVAWDPDLHLSVSMRSFRAENMSALVKALLDCEAEPARKHLEDLCGRFPVFITRSIEAAKKWIRSHARGSERYGLVASSRAMRLKPHAIDVRVPIDPVHWFLDEPSDARSSYYLEDAATEFQVQGLELDWVCMTWDADLRKTTDGWSYHDFRGSNWTKVNVESNRNYLKNAYRVLLTRARQGMVIFVPPGDHADATRLPMFYDSTFEYLVGLGIQVIDNH